MFSFFFIYKKEKFILNKKTKYQQQILAITKLYKKKQEYITKM